MSENGTQGLPSSWAWTTIGEVTELTIDQSGPSEIGDFLYVDISSIDNKAKKIVSAKIVPITQAPSRARQHLRSGDVVVSMTRPNLNAVAMVPVNMEHSIGSTGLHVLRTNVVHPSWLYYLVQTEAFISAMSGLVLGVLYPAVRPKDIRSYTVPLAPRLEQHRIVAEIEKQFTRLDAGVAALERARANLKRYRASVLKAACEGRLVPTEAELARAEGRDYEPADRLLALILKERRTKWESDQLAKMQAQGKVPKDDKWKEKYQEPAAPDTSDLPELPEGWVWATWEQTSTRVTVGHVGPMKHEYVQEGVPFLRSQNVRENRFDPDGLLYISRAFHRKLSKSVLHPGDLVVVRSGTVGVTCVIPESLGEANCSDLVLIQNPLGVDSRYGSFYMNSLARSFVNAGKVGIALTHFNTKSVAALPIAIPPLAEQHRIVAEVERRLSVIDELEAVITTNLKRAERLRQSILKRAFEGKLVPQDPHDESASVLLERIRAEHAGYQDVGARHAVPL